MHCQVRVSSTGWCYGGGENLNTYITHDQISVRFQESFAVILMSRKYELGITVSKH